MCAWSPGWIQGSEMGDEASQGPLLLWTMEDTANAERDCLCVLGFQLNDKMNVPAPAYQRRVGQPRWQGRWECLRR